MALTAATKNRLCAATVGRVSTRVEAAVQSMRQDVEPVASWQARHLALIITLSLFALAAVITTVIAGILLYEPIMGVQQAAPAPAAQDVERGGSGAGRVAFWGVLLVLYFFLAAQHSFLWGIGIGIALLLMLALVSLGLVPVDTIEFIMRSGG